MSIQAVAPIETEPYKWESARILAGPTDVANCLARAFRFLQPTASLGIDEFMSAGLRAELPASGGEA